MVDFDRYFFIAKKFFNYSRNEFWDSTISEINSLINQQEKFNNQSTNSTDEPEGEWSEKFGCYVTKANSFRDLRG